MRGKPFIPCSTVAAVVMFLCPGLVAAGQQPLFEHDSVLQVRIVAPFSTIRGDRSNHDYLDGAIYLPDPDSGAEQRLDLKLRPRGHFRRQREVCDFPPLRLNLRKKQLAGSAFEGQDKLKLVTHCESSRDNYEQNVLQEYLAYRILNMVTEQSFRVRLLRVTYADSERGGKELTKYAFLIEDENLLADRLGMQHSRVRELQYYQLDADQTSVFTIFQYLIGNTDFSAVLGARDEFCCHNAILLTNAVGQFTPVPYDFDFAGIVNAPYAAPGKQFKIRSVKERVYRGLCRHNGRLAGTIGRFKQQEQAIRQLVSEMEGLGNGTRRSTQRYIDEFYAAVASPEDIRRNFITACSSATAPPQTPAASPK